MALILHRLAVHDADMCCLCASGKSKVSSFMASYEARFCARSSVPAPVLWKCDRVASGGREGAHGAHNLHFRHRAISEFARNVVVIFYAIPMHVLRSKIIVVTGWNIHFVTNAPPTGAPGMLRLIGPRDIGTLRLMSAGQVQISRFNNGLTVVTGPLTAR